MPAVCVTVTESVLSSPASVTDSAAVSVTREGHLAVGVGRGRRRCGDVRGARRRAGQGDRLAGDGNRTCALQRDRHRREVHPVGRDRRGEAATSTPPPKASPELAAPSRRPGSLRCRQPLLALMKKGWDHRCGWVKSFWLSPM